MSTPEPQGFIDAMEQGAYRTKQVFNGLSAVTNFARSAVFILAAGPSALLRYNFGERYFRGTAVLSFFVYGLVASFMQYQPGILLMILMVAAILVHTLAARIRDSLGDPLFSYAHGRSFWTVLLPKYDQVCNLFLEPLTIFLFGILVMAFGSANHDPTATDYGLFTFFIAGVVLSNHLYALRRIREEKMNQTDAEIRAQAAQPALEGETSFKKTRGFVIPGAGTLTNKERNLLWKSFRGMDNDVAAMLKTPGSTNANGRADHPHGRDTDAAQKFDHQTEDQSSTRHLINSSAVTTGSV